MRLKPTVAHAVALYRVSTAEQGQSGLGLEAQQAIVRAFVAAQGGTLVAEFSDVASGKDDRRPGFQAALRRCRQLGGGAGRGAARPDHAAGPHAVAAARGRLLGPCRRHAGCGRPDDAGVCRDGAEGAGADQRAHPGGAGGGQGAGGGAGRGSRLPAVSAALCGCGEGPAWEVADQAAHRLWLEVERLRSEGVATMAGLARALTERGVPTPCDGRVWTHTTVARLMARVGA